VRSELGHGSTFSFSLPREERAQLPAIIFGERASALAAPEHAVEARVGGQETAP
jgi:hypothetical protein